MFEAYAPIGSPGRFFKQGGDPDVMEDPVIKEIAGKYNVTPAQVTCSLQVPEAQATPSVKWKRLVEGLSSYDFNNNNII